MDDKKLWKILKEMEIPNHLTCFRRTGHGTIDCSKLGKEYAKVVYCHPAYLTSTQSTSCEMPGWMNHKLESRLLGNTNILRYADETTVMVGNEDEQKSLLIKVKEESEKAGLKLSIQKTKIMASSPIISWQIDGETMETVKDFIFLGSKITADSGCSHEIKMLPP